MRAAMLAVVVLVAGCANPGGSQGNSSPQGGQAGAPVFLTPGDVQYKDGPPSLPAGAQFAVLEGNPRAAEVFTMRLKFPANYKIPPHYHPGVERVTVVSGVLNVALGDRFDATKAKEFKAGSFMRMDPGTRHFAFVKEETVIQLSTMGPWDLTYVNPADDPRKKASSGN